MNICRSLQKTVPSDSDEISKSLQSENQILIGSPVTKTTTTITKTVTTVITSYPVTSPQVEDKEENSSVREKSEEDGQIHVTSSSNFTPTVTMDKTTEATILSETLGLISSSRPVSSRPEHSITKTNNEVRTSEFTTTDASSTAETADCPEHLPEGVCQ